MLLPGPRSQPGRPQTPRWQAAKSSSPREPEARRDRAAIRGPGSNPLAVVANRVGPRKQNPRRPRSRPEPRFLVLDWILVLDWFLAVGCFRAPGLLPVHPNCQALARRADHRREEFPPRAAERKSVAEGRGRALGVCG